METGDSVQRSVLVQGRGRNVSFSLGFSYWGANPVAVVRGMKRGKPVDTRIQKYHIRLRLMKFAFIVKRFVLIVKKFAHNWKVYLNHEEVCP